MKPVANVVLRASMLLASCAAVAVPSAAQQGPGGTVYNLTKEERAALRPLADAVQAGNYSAAQAALSAARSGAASQDARYLVAAEELRLGIGTNNMALQAEAIDAILASGRAGSAEIPQLLMNQASIAISQGDRKKAEASLNRLLELDPNNLPAIEAVMRMRTEKRDYASSVRLANQLIAQQRATNQPVSQALYRYGLNYASVSSMMPQAMEFGRGLLATYPSASNWRDVLLTYRDMAKPDPAVTLDTWRLIRFSKALAGERDYLTLAQQLSQAGFATEAKAVLDEGASANMIDPVGVAATLRKTVNAKAALDAKGVGAKEKAGLAAATGGQALAAADIYFGRGEYAKAVPLYQAALQKGSIDTGAATSRLGMALALAGQRPEAEAAFRSMTGARADLGSFLLIWLQQRT